MIIIAGLVMTAIAGGIARSIDLRALGAVIIGEFGMFLIQYGIYH